MRQLVDNNIISYPLRHTAYALRDTNRAGAEIAAAEPGFLAGDVFNGIDLKLIFKIPLIKFFCPGGEIFTFIQFFF